VTIIANNMTLGEDTNPAVTMDGIIMTGNINQSGTIREGSGVFLSSY
jgi:hypothetical protein